MATVVSIQSGDWSDPSIWDGGSVPASTDEITIAAGHSVTLDTDFLLHGILHLSGTLTVAAGKILRVGTYAYGAGTEGTLFFNGGVLTGAGSVYIRVGSVYTQENAAWSYVKDLFYFGHEPDITGGRVDWNLRYVSFINVDTLYLVSHPGGRARVVEHTLNNCVFTTNATNKTLYLGGRSGYSKQHYHLHVDDCDFRGYATIQFSAGSSSYVADVEAYDRIIRNCTFFGSETSIMKINLSDSGVSLDIMGCMFCNARPDTGRSTLYRITRCYIGHDYPESAARTIDSTNIGSFFSNSISHLPNRAASNFHMMTIHNADNSYFEGWGTGGPNVLIRPATSYSSGVGTIQGHKLVWKHNIMGGVGQFAASTYRVPTDYDISNNTIASTGSQAMEVWMQETQEYVALDEGCILRNNLQVCTAPAEKDSGFALTAGGISVECPVDADYNCRWNMTGEWFRGYIRNMNAGLNNRESINPMFVDPTREIEKWGRFVTNNIVADYKAVWDILLRRNGYDVESHVQREDNIPSVGFADLLSWIREGFRPTNLALQTAGEGGTYIGALPVQAGVDSECDIDDDDTGEPVGTVADKLTHIVKSLKLLRENIVFRGGTVPVGLPLRKWARQVCQLSGGAAPSEIAQFSGVIEVEQSGLSIGTLPNEETSSSTVTLP